MRINIIILFLCFTFIFPCKVHAGVDPARAALIFSLQKRQERWYKAQAAAIAANC